MAFVPALNVAMVEARATYFGQNIENTLYFQHDGAMDATSVQALIDAITGDWLLDLRGQLAAEYSLHEWYVTDLSSATAPTYTIPESPPLAGVGAAGPGMPGSVALCVSFRTNGRGRSARGRNYVAGMQEPTVAANLVDAGVVNGIVASYQTMLPGGTLPAGWTWVVVSRYSGGVERSFALVSEITAVLVVDRVVDSQRGRLH